MIQRKLLIALAGLMLFAAPIKAGSQRFQEFVLFAGGNTDSTEQASRWIPIRGATRVYIRTWTTHAAWAANNADSSFSDSLITFNVLLSDSVSFIARDSAGVTVTASNLIPRTSSHGEPYPMCADSVIVPITTVGDTVWKMVEVNNFPINHELRAPATGSGIWTLVGPKALINTTTYYAEQRGTTPVGYMRIRCTPLRRATVATQTATVPHRVNGLKGFKMLAYVYTDNQ